MEFMSLKSFFAKPEREVKVVMLVREPTTLRVHEWRADRQLVSSAGKLFTNPDFRLMLQVVENDHPANVVLPAEQSIEMRAIFQARAEGYTMCMANLRALAKYEAPLVPLEEEFAPEST
jgi:hypothetical protein